MSIHYSLSPNTQSGAERKKAYKIAKMSGERLDYFPKYNKLAKIDAIDARNRLTKATGVEWIMCESEYISWM